MLWINQLLMPNFFFILGYGNKNRQTAAKG